MVDQALELSSPSTTTLTAALADFIDERYAIAVNIKQVASVS